MITQFEDFKKLLLENADSEKKPEKVLDYYELEQSADKLCNPVKSMVEYLHDIESFENRTLTSTATVI